MELQKMARTAGLLERLLKILQCLAAGVVALAAALLTVLTVLNAFGRPELLRTDSNALRIGSLSFEFAGEVAADGGALLLYAWSVLAAAALFAALLWWALAILRKILRTMAAGTPFASGVSGEIRRLAFLSLGLGAVQNGIGLIEDWSLPRVFDIERLLENSAFRSVTVNYTFQADFVVVFLVLLLLSCVFRYGAELQKLSDETV